MGGGATPPIKLGTSTYFYHYAYFSQANEPSLHLLKMKPKSALIPKRIGNNEYI
jgi:hypothetical protein